MSIPDVYITVKRSFCRGPTEEKSGTVYNLTGMLTELNIFQALSYE